MRWACQFAVEVVGYLDRLRDGGPRPTRTVGVKEVRYDDARHFVRVRAALPLGEEWWVTGYFRALRDFSSRRVRLVSHLGFPDADWGDTSLELPAGAWRDELGGAERAGGRMRLAELLSNFPMALLVRASA